MLQEKYEQLIKEKGTDYVLRSLADIAGTENVLSFLRHISGGEYVEHPGLFPELSQVNQDWYEPALKKNFSNEDVIGAFQTYVGLIRFSEYIQFIFEEEIDVYFEDYGI